MDIIHISVTPQETIHRMPSISPLWHVVVDPTFSNYNGGRVRLPFLDTVAIHKSVTLRCVFILVLLNKCVVLLCKWGIIMMGVCHHSFCSDLYIVMCVFSVMRVVGVFFHG